MNNLKELCRGKWRGILSTFGISEKYLVNRHGPCPICCDGKDRFRFDDKGGDGTWFCSQCGAGNGFQMIKLVKGWQFKQVAKEVEKIVGKVDQGTIPQAENPEEIRAERRTIFSASKPVEADDLTSRFLARRGLGSYRPCTDLRTLSNSVIFKGRTIAAPGMVAVVRGPDGKVVTMHRRAIEPDGTGQKQMLCRGSFPGGSAIRLFVPSATLGVAEGITTAVAAALIHKVPTWALINAGNMEKFIIPQGVKTLFIFGDWDSSYTGQEAAYSLAKKSVARSKATGLDVCRVSFPDLSRPDFDWNDLLLEKLNAQGGSMKHLNAEREGSPQ